MVGSTYSFMDYQAELKHTREHDKSAGPQNIFINKVNTISMAAGSYYNSNVNNNKVKS